MIANMASTPKRGLRAATFLILVATAGAAATAEMQCNRLATAEQRQARRSRAAERTAEFIAALAARDFVGAADFFRYLDDRAAAELEVLMGAVMRALELIVEDLGVPTLSAAEESSWSGLNGQFWSVDVASQEEYWPFVRAIQKVCAPTVERVAFQSRQPGIVSLVLDDDSAGGGMEVIAAQFGLHPSVPRGKERLDARIARLFAWRAPPAAEGLARQPGRRGG